MKLYTKQFTCKIHSASTEQTLPATSDLCDNASHQFKNFPWVYLMAGGVMTQLPIASSSKCENPTFLNK